MKRALITLLAAASAFAAEPEFPLTADSKPQPGVAKGTMIKGTYTAKDGSVFPGTVREYQLYLPAAFDKTKPAPFMVFQDGVIYQAPVVFDNLIVKKDIPPLVGLFIKPGVVPAANDNALPRFNRSYEYDSVTDTYSRFLIEEFLPAIEAEHGLQLSTDPNHAAIAGNSSGGICAFMAAWHRPDRFRRVFTGVGTYVGIRGADRLPVLVRKIEPKPLRVFLQSGTGDNDLYCGDWWMANQMMQRSLAWAGYDVHHAWGEGGHNQKHASQVFPDAMRWLWRGWQTDMEVKTNAKGESKWKGYEVVGDGAWEEVTSARSAIIEMESPGQMVSDKSGHVFYIDQGEVKRIDISGHITTPYPDLHLGGFSVMRFGPEGSLYGTLPYMATHPGLVNVKTPELVTSVFGGSPIEDMAVKHDGSLLLAVNDHFPLWKKSVGGEWTALIMSGSLDNFDYSRQKSLRMVLSPDQSLVYLSSAESPTIQSFQLDDQLEGGHRQAFIQLDELDDMPVQKKVMCVDTNGWLYVATSLGIQVCDQAGRVNFIIRTPKPAHDVCFGGKDLSELFIACGDTIYKRPTKAKGVVSGQQAPIKPAPPKL